MKRRLLAVFFIAAILVGMIACNQKSEMLPQKIEVNRSAGRFEITQQEFMDRWNSTVEDFQKRSNNDKAQYLILFPEVEVKKEETSRVSLGPGLEVEFEKGVATEKIRDIDIIYYKPRATKEDAMTFGFMIAAMPAFFNPDIDAAASGFGESGISEIYYDGDITYVYVADEAIEILSISVTKGTK